MNFKDLDKSFNRFFPATQDAASPKTASVTARLENVVSGVCPYCKEVMRSTTCCDQTMYVCDKDRAVFPIENQVL